MSGRRGVWRPCTRVLAVTGMVLSGGVEAAAQQTARAPEAYRDASRPIEERVRDLLGRMTLEEKFWQLFMIPGDLDDPAHDYSHGVFGLQVAADEGAPGSIAAHHANRINAIQRYLVEETRLGIPMIAFEEALHGLKSAGAMVFPQAIALAATWDKALVGEVAAAAARETRSRGIRQVLSPVVNIASDTRWGRVEETYGEDPELSAVMGEAFVRAFEAAGVITTPKHFVANVGDGGRDSYPIDLNARLLEEIHFPPFVRTIQAGARSIMTSYNSIDGAPATQNRWLLTDVLKRGWDFRGFVISDQAATGGATVLHHTEESTASAAQHALEAGLDVIFQSSWPQHRPYLDAFRSGRISHAAIDSAVSRVLRAKFQLGLFEAPYVAPESAAHWNGHAQHRRLAREAARASIVLLKNGGNVLPLEPDLGSIAVIGVDADEVRLGGYSGPGIAPVSILDALRARLSSAIRFAAGPGRAAPAPGVVPAALLTTMENGRRVSGLRGEYFTNNRLEGEPATVRLDAAIDFRWTFNAPARGLSNDWYSVRWSGTLTAPEGGITRIGLEGKDGYRLWLDDKLIIDNWRKQSYRTMLADVQLEAGQSYDIRVEYFETIGNARIRLVFENSSDTPQAEIEDAVAIAAASDVALIVAGIEEGEFRDRAFLALPGHQEALIRRVAALGKPVIVALVGGSAITMSGWLDDVDAVVHVWYPGEEGGHAVADVLLGDHNPSGRLPITFPMAEGQLPLVYNHKPTGRGDDYLDLTGQPLFPFGFGLSYTTFEYDDLRIGPAEILADGVATVRVTIRNTGARAGHEVVQLYVRDLLASAARPVLELKGFERIRLEPGESREVTFTLTSRELSMLDADLRRVVEPGAFRILVGASSQDIRLRGELRVR